MSRFLRIGMLSVVSLAIVAVSINSLSADDDVTWLNEVTIPPKSLPESPAPELRPLLQTPSGEAISTLPEWKTERQRLRAAWLKFLGPMPTERLPVELKVLRTDELPGVIRQLVEYESEPGITVQGYLLRPAEFADDKRIPALVALHATTNDTIDRIAGLTGDPTRQIGLQLAQRGFVVFCPRCFLWQDVRDINDAVAKFRERHPQTLGMHKMLYDAQRGIDVLASLPYVDPQRIGAVGHSLGAKETLYLAAFDERIQAAVASEGGLRFESTNWEDLWYLGEAIEQPEFELNHHELLALVAPRPLLILAGESGRGAADGDLNWPYLLAAQPIYRLYDRPVRLGMYNHRQGHAIPPEAFERMAVWLETYLRNP